MSSRTILTSFSSNDVLRIKGELIKDATKKGFYVPNEGFNPENVIGEKYNGFICKPYSNSSEIGCGFKETEVPINEGAHKRSDHYTGFSFKIPSGNASTYISFLESEPSNGLDRMQK